MRKRVSVICGTFFRQNFPNDELINRLFALFFTLTTKTYCGRKFSFILIENAYQLWLMARNRLMIYECHFNLRDYYDSVDLCTKNSSVSDWWLSINKLNYLINHSLDFARWLSECFHISESVESENVALNVCVFNGIF
jgi:hypothetical protein